MPKPELCPSCKPVICDGTEVIGSAYRVIAAAQAKVNVITLREIRTGGLNEREINRSVALSKRHKALLDMIYREIEEDANKLRTGD